MARSATNPDEIVQAASERLPYWITYLQARITDLHPMVGGTTDAAVPTAASVVASAPLPARSFQLLEQDDD